jgi:hypothetical protein
VPVNKASTVAGRDGRSPNDGGNKNRGRSPNDGQANVFKSTDHSRRLFILGRALHTISKLISITQEHKLERVLMHAWKHSRHTLLLHHNCPAPQYRCDKTTVVYLYMHAGTGPRWLFKAPVWRLSSMHGAWVMCRLPTLILLLD